MRWSRVAIIAASVATAASVLAVVDAEPVGAADRNVRINGNQYRPADITIDFGDRVIWRNEDNTGHTVTADSGQFDSPEMGPGDNFNFTFNDAGTFGYFCRIHGQSMRGVVRVRPKPATTTTLLPSVTTTTAPASTTTARPTTTTTKPTTTTSSTSTSTTSTTEPPTTTTSSTTSTTSTTLRTDDSSSDDDDDSNGAAAFLLAMAIVIVAGAGGVLLWRLRPNQSVGDVDLDGDDFDEPGTSR